MSDTAPLVVRPGAGADPLAAARARLREALQALREEEARFSALTESQERARRSQWAHMEQAEAAQAELAEAESDEPTRIAYDFANSVTSPSPVRAVKVKLEAAQSNAERVGPIEEAIGRELEQVERRLANRNYAIRECLAAVVIASPAFARLFEELDRAWAHLRGIKKACLEIQTALKGHMPREYERKWQDSIPLDPTVRWPHGPIPTDEAPAAAWATALQQLLQNPDAELPSGG